MALSDWYPGIRPNTPYSGRWRSFLDDLRNQGVSVDPSQSGGFANRNIRGTMTPSLHASDRAYDVNWRANPEGSRQDEADIARQHLERDMGGSNQPITQIHPMIARETAARHGARWGGDFRTRSPDPMHFEFPANVPGGMPGRSLIAQAGLTPPTPTPAPTGAPQMATGRGLASMLFPAANAAETPQPPAPGFNPGMLAQIMQALQPQAPAQAQQSAGGGMLDWMLPPEQRGAGGAPPNLDWMLPQAQRGPAPPAPMGVPQMPAAPQQPPTPSAMDIGWQPPEAEPQNIETPLPITPIDPEAIMAGATNAQTQRQQAEQAQPGYFERLMSNPAFLAGLSILGTAPGGNWGPNAAQTISAARRGQREDSEYQRQQRQRSTMDRVWAEAFPGGQPNMQHPLLTGQSPQVAAMIAGLGPEQALPLLAKSAMERRQLELKDIGGQGVIFDPRTGQTQAVPGTQAGKPPSGFRYAEGSNGQRLEPIPGGPGEQLPGEIAGRMALMQTARTHMPKAREFFLNRLNASEAGRHAIGGAMLAPGYNQAQRTAELAVESAIRAASGANAPEPEVQRYIQMFTPRVTDPKEVRQQKLDMLEQFMTNAEANATRGRGGPQPPAGGDGFSIRRLQ